MSLPRPRLLRLLPTLALVAGLTVACGGSSDTETTETAEAPTRAQRDSAIAESALPGAGAVGTALDATAAAAARAEAHDTIN